MVAESAKIAAKIFSARDRILTCRGRPWLAKVEAAGSAKANNLDKLGERPKASTPTVRIPDTSAMRPVQI